MSRVFLLLLSLFTLAGLASCTDTTDQAEKQSEQDPAMKTTPSIDIQGHRGCRGLLPENSIPAFLKAIDLGVTTLELDVIVSRDSQLVVSHEPWLSAVICNNPDGLPIEEDQQRSWNLFQMTVAEIQQCDCGSRPHPRFPDQQLMTVVKPTLAEVIDTVEAYLRIHGLPKVRYNIETKSDPRGDHIFHPEPETFTDLLLELIAEKGIEEQVMIQSFDPRTLQVAHRQAPDIDLVLLHDGMTDKDSLMSQLGFVPMAYSPAFSTVDQDIRSWTRALGMALVPWTVNEPSDMQRMLDLGVDGIITDYPDRLIELLKSAP